jgi:membrane-bound metal-dependent hydrolase YbcI (DUF457 family)
MTILPHLLLTTVGVQALGLEGGDVVLAYTFGYGIDLVDHPIKLPLYLKKNGKKNEKHYHWRTPLQEPVALMWIVPLSLYLGTYVPALFFISHFVLDYMVSYEKRPFYPFNTYTTEGILRKYSDTAKEIWTCVVCGALSVLMGWHHIVALFAKVITG